MTEDSIGGAEVTVAMNPMAKTDSASSRPDETTRSHVNSYIIVGPGRTGSMFLRDLLIGQATPEYVWEYQFSEPTSGSKYGRAVRKPFLIHTHTIEDVKHDIDYGDVTILCSLRRNVVEYLGSHILAEGIDRFTYRATDKIEPIHVGHVDYGQKRIAQLVYRMEAFLRYALNRGLTILWYEDWIHNVKVLENYGLDIFDTSTSIVRTPHNKWDHIDLNELRKAYAGIRRERPYYLLWNYTQP